MLTGQVWLASVRRRWKRVASVLVRDGRVKKFWCDWAFCPLIRNLLRGSRFLIHAVFSEEPFLLVWIFLLGSIPFSYSYTLSFITFYLWNLGELYVAYLLGNWLLTTAMMTWICTKLQSTCCWRSKSLPLKMIDWLIALPAYFFKIEEQNGNLWMIVFASSMWEQIKWM